MNFYRHIADRPTLEREYSPSSCAPGMAEIIARYGRESDEVRRSGRPMRTVAYGEHPAEEIDLFPAGVSRAAPLLIYLHGGYWQELGKADHAFPAPALAALGMHYAAVGYGLAPASTLDEMVDRCRRAVAWLVIHAAELGVDPAAIHLCGCSAGGHLAAMTALADWPGLGAPPAPLASLILLSGVFDLRPIRLTYVNDALGMSQDQALRNSPLLQIDAFQGEFPPTLAVIAEHEPAEFKRQSREFIDALVRKRLTARLHELPGRNHFDVIFDLADPATAFGALMLDHIFSSHF